VADVHMIAAAFELHHCLAAVAFLKFVLFGSLEKLKHLRILRAVLTTMRPTAACHADHKPALLAMPNIVTNILRWDPFTAVGARAVYPVHCGKLEILCIPQFLVLIRQEVLGVPQRNMVRCAAFRWHVSRIRQRQNKEPL